MDECRKCGAAVISQVKHRKWHDDVEARIDDAESTAEDALERAEQAQNVLYQNNIQI